MLSRRLRSLARGARPQVMAAGLLGLAAIATHVGQGLAVAAVLARVLDGERLVSIVPFVAGFVVLQAVRVVILRTREQIGTRAAYRVKTELRRRLYTKLVELGPAYTTGERSGAVQTTLIDSVERLDRYVAAFLPQVLSSLVGAALIAAAIVAIDPWVGLLVVACSIVVVVSPLVTRRFVHRSLTDWGDQYRKLYADSLDAIQGMTTLKAFNAHRQREQELRRDGEAFATASIRLTALSTVYEGALGVAASVGTTLAVVVGAYRLVDGALDVTALLVLLMLTRECFRPLIDLQRAFHSAYAAPNAASQVYALLDTPAPLTLATAGRQRAPRTAASEGLGFGFQDVTFRYRPGRRPALEGFTLEVTPGETVALVGRSGSGKSTAVQLLLRFADPQAGRVQIGGSDLRDLDLTELHRTVAVVAQDTYLFHGTVRSNVLVGNPDATDRQLDEALQAADVAGFVGHLPAGLDTPIGERGIKLSGGQRQRIAIARALLVDAPILVLDEATSSLDGASEAAIQTALDRLRAERTCLIVAHRLSTVRDADRIAVLDRGRVVEAGRPADLLTSGGPYSRLVAAQQDAT